MSTTGYGINGPRFSGYLDAMGRAAFSGIRYCREFAIGVGRPVWVQQPAWNPATIRLMRAVCQGRGLFFIHRELKDCLKSAKAQGVTFSKAEVEEFCPVVGRESQLYAELDWRGYSFVPAVWRLGGQAARGNGEARRITSLDDLDPNVCTTRSIPGWAKTT